MPRLTAWETVIKEHPEIDDLLCNRQNKLKNYIDKLIRDRNFNCTVDKIDTKQYSVSKNSACTKIFLDIVDDQNNINKVELRLFYRILIPANKCWLIDKRAKIPNNISDYSRVLLRILWYVYITCIEYQNGNTASIVLGLDHKGIDYTAFDSGDLAFDSGGLSNSASWEG